VGLGIFGQRGTKNHLAHFVRSFWIVQHARNLALADRGTHPNHHSLVSLQRCVGMCQKDLDHELNYLSRWPHRRHHVHPFGAGTAMS
jgi:hypothetical protein